MSEPSTVLPKRSKSVPMFGHVLLSGCEKINADGRSKDTRPTRTQPGADEDLAVETVSLLTCRVPC